jgi:hypothetical protein
MRSRGNWRLFYNEISMVYAFAVLFCPARQFLFILQRDMRARIENSISFSFERVSNLAKVVGECR